MLFKCCLFLSVGTWFCFHLHWFWIWVNPCISWFPVCVFSVQIPIEFPLTVVQMSWSVPLDVWVCSKALQFCCGEQLTALGSAMLRMGKEVSIGVQEEQQLLVLFCRCILVPSAGNVGMH